MLPSDFCSENLAFLLAPSFPPIDQNDFSQFTVTRIPVGAWPPQSDWIGSNMDTKQSSASYSSHLESNPATQISPMPHNIALVRFAYVPSKQVDCIRCLMERSEAYLLYVAEKTPDGYVWMRQAPVNILKSCLGKLCSSLTYDEQGVQIQRPSGTLQLTTDDNTLSREL
nr:AlNc14C148G7456 [Albugo laibachii Nc14]|eukprot:CCA22269.1 AlNc14C148G7456 [Albugo laibachii Nc14]